MEKVGLGEAVARYLARLTPEERAAFQQELNRFIRWYGRDRPLPSLTPPEIANYAERASGAKRLEAVRAFLTYAKKEGLTPTNLALHLRPKKEPKAGVARPAPTPISPLTPQGYAQLQVELESRKGELAQVVEEVRRARQDGDLSENAPYQAARERQRQLEARIRELEAILGQPVTEEVRRPLAVGLGSWVSLSDLASGEVVSFCLVNPWEVDPSQGKISLTSPLGKALVGKREGEEVEVMTPAGSRRYRLAKIETR